jgi:hypothetical protein
MRMLERLAFSLLKSIVSDQILLLLAAGNSKAMVVLSSWSDILRCLCDTPLLNAVVKDQEKHALLQEMKQKVTF